MHGMISNFEALSSKGFQGASGSRTRCTGVGGGEGGEGGIYWPKALLAYLPSYRRDAVCRGAVAIIWRCKCAGEYIF